MLTNKDLQDINKIILELSLLQIYVDTLPTTITPADISQDINILKNIYTKAKMQKAKQSASANAWNKVHPEKHNETNKRYAKNKKLKEEQK